MLSSQQIICSSSALNGSRSVQQLYVPPCIFHTGPGTKASAAPTTRAVTRADVLSDSPVRGLCPVIPLYAWARSPAGVKSIAVVAEELIAVCAR